MLVHTLAKSLHHGIVQTLYASKRFILICLLAGLLQRSRKSSYRKKKVPLYCFGIDTSKVVWWYLHKTLLCSSIHKYFPAPVPILFHVEIYDKEQTKLLATLEVLRRNRSQSLTLQLSCTYFTFENSRTVLWGSAHYKH